MKTGITTVVIANIIDPDEKPPLDRWVQSVGELNARLDYL